MINRIKTDASQSHHRDLPLANRNQSRSQQNYNPYIYYYYVDTNICRTSVLGKPVTKGKALAVGKPSTGKNTYVRLAGTYTVSYTHQTLPTTPYV